MNLEINFSDNQNDKQNINDNIDNVNNFNDNANNNGGNNNNDNLNLVSSVEFTGDILGGFNKNEIKEKEIKIDEVETPQIKVEVPQIDEIKLNNEGNANFNYGANVNANSNVDINVNNNVDNKLDSKLNADFNADFNTKTDINLDSAAINVAKNVNPDTEQIIPIEDEGHHNDVFEEATDNLNDLNDFKVVENENEIPTTSPEAKVLLSMEDKPKRLYESNDD